MDELHKFFKYKFVKSSMAFKINISQKGKTYKLEIEAPAFIGKKVGGSVAGKDFDSKLEGYEFKITGASDKQGFPALANVEGMGLKRVLLTRGKGLRKVKKKKKLRKPVKGLKLRKSVHANTIDEDIIQINLSVIKQEKGAKSLGEVFVKKEKTEEKTKEETTEEETKEEEPAEEETKEEKKEEKPVEEKKSTEEGK